MPRIKTSGKVNIHVFRTILNLHKALVGTFEVDDKTKAANTIEIFTH